MSALPGTHVTVLLGATFVLSALWCAIMLVLVSSGGGAARRPARGHAAVELAWAVIPVVVTLAVVLPALHAGWSAGEEGPKVAEIVGP